MNDINMKMFKNNKTGNKYAALNTAIDCTNSQNEQYMVVYTPVDCLNDAWYVRSSAEFFMKFTEVANDYVNETPWLSGMEI